MVSAALIFLLSLALMTNSLCILNHMTPQTSHVARTFYSSTAVLAFFLMLAQPKDVYWAWVWLYAGFAVLHLWYQPEFVTKRHIPWFFGEGHRRDS